MRYHQGSTNQHRSHDDDDHTSSSLWIPPSMYRLCLVAFAVAMFDRVPLANSFLQAQPITHHHHHYHCQYHQMNTFFLLQAAGGTDDYTTKAYDPEEEVKRRLARAKAVLEKSKQKLEQNQQTAAAAAAAAAATEESSSTTTTSSSNLPFFAAKKATANTDPQRRRERVIKARDESTGLITADGEKMAAMSEQEEWEIRPLSEVFDNEMEENADVYSLASQQLADRDVVASIWNLRKVMKTEDYMRIFDKKNWFIGEDN
ncbi:expressed unknown protein [Seminavis robusta]|uniref:Uncharacterized protein n=1 Tax=Seminavis robusta TaxID=568900 RepID=A0A9N8D963_9STRA|nr:expressed unknown protein [Seminavis robusta]|eukprot:Sro6_g005150.1 n/a (259) ;mRNA; f:113497-114273